MDAGAPPRLHQVEAPAALQAWLLGLVERDEPAALGVQRLLPELRPSIQVHHGARFWLRHIPRGAPWQPVPRVAFWAPRAQPWLAYASGRVQAFALLLSPCGRRALLREAAGSGAPVQGLATVEPELARALDHQAGEDFAHWQERVLAVLAERLRHAPPPDALDRSAEALASGLALADCAAASGLSERQFRRRFAERHGLSPKAYQRHLRVDRLLRRLHERPWEADPGPLHDDGFADQAHAIREFRALTGLTPGAYQRLKRGSDLSLRSVPQPAEPPPSLPG